mmetsp:Transcript_23802/g.80433  ORF Transcript_23802/g.80433 Transcript_23802/m.80433 type:complete len:215 (-) Transcript_23802:641-1285(-)
MSKSMPCASTLRKSTSMGSLDKIKLRGAWATMLMPISFVQSLCCGMVRASASNLRRELHSPEAAVCRPTRATSGPMATGSSQTRRATCGGWRSIHDRCSSYADGRGSKQIAKIDGSCTTRSANSVRTLAPTSTKMEVTPEGSVSMPSALSSGIRPKSNRTWLILSALAEAWSAARTRVGWLESSSRSAGNRTPPAFRIGGCSCDLTKPRLTDVV